MFRLIDSLMTETRPSQNRNWTIPGGWLRNPKPDRQFQLSLRSLTPVVAPQTASPVAWCVIFQLIGTTLLHVVPLGLGQVNQLHESNSDSPARKVLLNPSVTSRIATTRPRPSRFMIPDWVPASP